MCNPFWERAIYTVGTNKHGHHTLNTYKLFSSIAKWKDEVVGHWRRATGLPPEIWLAYLCREAKKTTERIVMKKISKGAGDRNVLSWIFFSERLVMGMFPNGKLLQMSGDGDGLSRVHKAFGVRMT